MEHTKTLFHSCYSTPNEPAQFFCRDLGRVSGSQKWRRAIKRDETDYSRKWMGSESQQSKPSMDMFSLLTNSTQSRSYRNKCEDVTENGYPPQVKARDCCRKGELRWSYEAFFYSFLTNKLWIFLSWIGWDEEIVLKCVTVWSENAFPSGVVNCHSFLVKCVGQRPNHSNRSMQILIDYIIFRFFEQ